MHGKGNVYDASVKWAFQVMEDGRRFWLEGVKPGEPRPGASRKQS